MPLSKSNIIFKNKQILISNNVNLNHLHVKYIYLKLITRENDAFITQFSKYVTE